MRVQDTNRGYMEVREGAFLFVAIQRGQPEWALSVQGEGLVYSRGNHFATAQAAIEAGRRWVRSLVSE
jgi:hypothetical protein